MQAHAAATMNNRADDDTLSSKVQQQEGSFCERSCRLKAPHAFSASFFFKIVDQLKWADGIHCVHYVELLCTLHNVNRTLEVPLQIVLLHSEVV